MGDDDDDDDEDNFWRRRSGTAAIGVIAAVTVAPLVIFGSILSTQNG